jgi:hypothetical protein
MNTTNIPCKVERLKIKPLLLTLRRKRRARNVKIATKRVILKTNAGQRVVAIKVEGLNVKARTMIRKTAIRLLQL